MKMQQKHDKTWQQSDENVTKNMKMEKCFERKVIIKKTVKKWWQQYNVRSIW